MCFHVPLLWPNVIKCILDLSHTLPVAEKQALDTSPIPTTIDRQRLTSCHHPTKIGTQVIRIEYKDIENSLNL